jgi:hypothetical protein
MDRREHSLRDHANAVDRFKAADQALREMLESVHQALELAKHPGYLRIVDASGQSDAVRPLNLFDVRTWPKPDEFKKVIENWNKAYIVLESACLILGPDAPSDLFRPPPI